MNDDGGHQLKEVDGTVRVFTPDGYLSTVLDRNTNRLSVARDANGFILSVTDDSGRAVAYAKGADGRVASITDPASRVYQFAYDNSGNLVRITDPIGNSTRLVYDGNNRLTSITNATGAVMYAVSYDAGGRVSTMQENSQEWTYTYNPAARNTIKRNYQGFEWSFDYDENGNITRAVDPLGSVELFGFDSSQNLISYVDKEGRKTSYSYDSAGNLTRLVDPLGNITTLAYDVAINRLTRIDRSGIVSSFVYDSTGNVISATDPAGSQTVLGRDARGQLTSIQDASGGRILLTYDTYGNLTTRTDRLGNVTAFSFDVAGRFMAYTDPANHTTAYSYDDAGHRVSRTAANGDTTAWRYDAAGNVTSVTVANAGAMRFTYDQFGRINKVIDPLNRTRQFIFDRDGNIVSVISANGRHTLIRRDPLGRITSKELPEGLTTYQHDRVGNLLSVNTRETSLSWIYDSNNRVLEARSALMSGAQDRIQYAYDAKGNQLTMVDPQGGTTIYNYDPMSRLTALTDPQGQTFGFEHDSLSRRTTLTRPNGVITRYEHDPESHIVSIAHVGTQGDYAQSYTYDSVGNRIQTTGGVGSYSYEYDAVNRLTAAKHLADLSAETYNYDGAGNRTSSHLSDRYVYDAANELLQDSTTKYMYDAEGRLSAKSDIVSGRFTKFSYDSEGKLVQVQLPNGVGITYLYDGLGRLTQRSSGSDKTTYVYDGNRVLIRRSSSGETYFVNGPGMDEWLAVDDSSGRRYPLYDVSGSVLQWLGSGGDLSSPVSMDSFGGIGGSAQVAAIFQGHPYDRDTGLYYFRARFYDPNLGRFITPDPRTQFDQNLYGFANNNPMAFVDPSGQSPILNNIIEKIKDWGIDKAFDTAVDAAAEGLSALYGLPIGVSQAIVYGGLVVGALAIADDVLAAITAWEIGTWAAALGTSALTGGFLATLYEWNPGFKDYVNQIEQNLLNEAKNKLKQCIDY
jgi:RHS repeat-associated protein